MKLKRLSNPTSTSWPLHSIAATRQLEHDHGRSVPPHSLMERAGRAVAKLAIALRPHAQTIWIVAGPGNNGGDALVAARILHEAGKRVFVSRSGVHNALPNDAQNALQRAIDTGVPMGSSLEPPCPLQPEDLAIDGLLGLGANRPPEGTMADFIRRMSHDALRCAVLAIDLPSGLNADTGRRVGDTAVYATHTLSMLTLKPGLFTADGRDHAGEVWFTDLGIDLCAEPPVAHLTARPRPPHREHAQHKGSFGDVIVVGGDDGMAGAAVLAARAAHAAGAGRVLVDLLQEHPLTLDVLRPELMFRHRIARDGADAVRNATVLAGCGGGQRIAEALTRLMSLAPRLVLDADALNQIATDNALQSLLRAREARGHSTVLTPHPLEAARLLETQVHAVQADRLAAAQHLAERTRAVVVLKGSGSVIAGPGRTPFINPTGNAALASAGTGDVLAGWLAGTWAAGGSDPFATAARSTWLHGHAADGAKCIPLRAADLIEAMHHGIHSLNNTPDEFTVPQQNPEGRGG